MRRRRRIPLPLLGFVAAPTVIVTLVATASLLHPQSCGSLPVASASSGWVTVGATIDPTYTGGAYQQDYNGGLSYAELGATPGYPNYVGGLITHTLGLPASQNGLPGGFALLVRPVGSSSPGIRILKSDIGSGQAGDLHYVIDLHPQIAQLLSFHGKQDIEIKAADGSPGANPASLASSGSPGCSPAALAASGYANPFAHTAGLAPNRIDMGVDYDGTGEIDALGTAKITFAQTGIGGGWTCSTQINGGVVYQLQDGPYAGRYIYVAEDVIPAVHNGQEVAAGQHIADLPSHGCLETGFATGSGSPNPQAAALRQQSTGPDAGENRTYCGQQMSNLLASTGTPPGLTEGKPISGTSC